MIAVKSKAWSWLKKIIIAGVILIIISGIAIWYIFTEKFTDTREIKPDYVIDAISLIREFEANDSLANRKYADEIVEVSGRVTELEPADTTMNLKMSDTVKGSYIIFAFQKENLRDAKKIKIGDNVTLRGSCSGGTYSEILEVESINFKRTIVTKNITKL